ncbi:MAG TPA: hypothetical protein IAA30_06940 [Candidatus Treponema faecavium]|nr:hypothetical protein [Candidatus Treponema faecavium]
MKKTMWLGIGCALVMAVSMIGCDNAAEGPTEVVLANQGIEGTSYTNESGITLTLSGGTATFKMSQKIADEMVSGDISAEYMNVYTELLKGVSYSYVYDANMLLLKKNGEIVLIGAASRMFGEISIQISEINSGSSSGTVTVESIIAGSGSGYSVYGPSI